MNIGSALKVLLPRKARLAIYVIVAIAVLVFAAWQAANGDWLLFAASLAVSLQSILAAGNVTPAPEPEPEPEGDWFNG
jgi:hypothetical protein